MREERIGRMRIDELLDRTGFSGERTRLVETYDHVRRVADERGPLRAEALRWLTRLRGGQ